ncbi:MAG: hypothetical protein CMQ54_03205 [Gammaproteobacteria bacterium]|nr:hypothetical protein [Gammaproteobacteria bacterium]|tara:strand:+ start:6220 stop:7578 length:1359 start_codon:yes stop_codon:yes gene_type:complete
MNNLNTKNLVSSIWDQPFEIPNTAPPKADIVIIGGGIIGISTAWFLAKQGINVVLCEKGHIAGEQSGRNWGWVRVQGRDAREIPLVLESMRIWDGLKKEIGEDVGYVRSGCLYTANTPKELEKREDWIKIARKYGINTRLIDSRELKKLVSGPTLDWAGAMYTESDARAEPHLAVPAISRAAVNNGAQIITSCAVRGIETSGGSVSAVITESGTIKTSVVLCAAGSWTSMFCNSLNIKVPQLKVLGTVARTAPAEKILNGALFGNDLGVRRRQDGGYTVAHGSVFEHPITPSSFKYLSKFSPTLLKNMSHIRLSLDKTFINELMVPNKWNLNEKSIFEKVRVLNPSPSLRALKIIRKNLDSMFPKLAETPFVEAWAGMIETTPDVIPVIDSISELPGFHVATGFSGHGFGIGPGAGKVIANLLSGTSSDIDMSHFKLNRFFDGSSIRAEGFV